MTANRRIFLNIVVAYGWSLYALVIGLFCGWRMFDGLGGLMTSEMVKYAISDDGKNGQI